MERALQAGARALYKALEGAINGLISGAYGAAGEEGVKLMIDRGWHVLDILFNAAHGFVEYPKDLSPEAVQRLEAFRRAAVKPALGALGLAKQIASRLPHEVLESKLTAKWALEKLASKHPSVAQAIKEHPLGKEWLEAEMRILRLYLMGRAVYSPALRKLVEVPAVG